MGTVNFNLNKVSADTPQTIFMLFRFQGERLKYSTGFAVLPKHWSEERQQVKNVTHVSNKDAINRVINDLRGEVSRIYAEMKAKGQPVTIKALRQQLDIFTGKEKAPERDFFGFVRAYIAEAPNKMIPGTGKTIKERTVQKYRTTLTRLEAFAKTYRRAVDFETIDLQFYADFLEYLKTLNYSTNGAGKFIATLKVFLNAATLQGITISPAVKSGHFKMVSEEADAVYLNETELETLFALDLTNSPRLERVRDLFLVGCWTGLRFSDFTDIKPENIKGGFIHIEQFKTGGRVIVPIHPMVSAIIEKYKGNLPKSISNQKMNDFVKEVCQLAGINGMETKSITRGGKKEVRECEKWELVTTHTARRSFATNAYLRNVPVITIMGITGHKTVKSFMKYIKLTPDEHAQLLQRYWQGERPKVLAVVANA